MLNVFGGFASLLFFVGAIFVLARADSWSKLSSLLLCLGIVLVPTLSLILAYQWVAPMWVFETVGFLVSVGTMVILFALAKMHYNCYV